MHSASHDASLQPWEIPGWDSSSSFGAVLGTKRGTDVILVLMGLVTASQRATSSTRHRGDVSTYLQSEGKTPGVTEIFEFFSPYQKKMQSVEPMKIESILSEQKENKCFSI